MCQCGNVSMCQCDNVKMCQFDNVSISAHYNYYCNLL
jgi:hypothetical protein